METLIGTELVIVAGLENFTMNDLVLALHRVKYILWFVSPYPSIPLSGSSFARPSTAAQHLRRFHLSPRPRISNGNNSSHKIWIWRPAYGLHVYRQWYFLRLFGYQILCYRKTALCLYGILGLFGTTQDGVVELIEGSTLKYSMNHHQRKQLHSNAKWRGGGGYLDWGSWHFLEWVAQLVWRCELSPDKLGKGETSPNVAMQIGCCCMFTASKSGEGRLVPSYCIPRFLFTEIRCISASSASARAFDRLP